MWILFFVALLPLTWAGELILSKRFESGAIGGEAQFRLVHYIWDDKVLEYRRFIFWHKVEYACYSGSAISGPSWIPVFEREAKEAVEFIRANGFGAYTKREQEKYSDGLKTFQAFQKKANQIETL